MPISIAVNGTLPISDSGILDANMFLADLLHQIFANKLVDDNRIDDPLFTFDVPMSGGSNATTTCSFLSPDFVFYFQLIAVRRENPNILL